MIERNLVVEDRDVVETLHPDGAGLPEVGQPAPVQQVVTDQQVFHRLVLRLGVKATGPIQISGYREWLKSSLSVIFRDVGWFPHYAMSPDVEEDRVCDGDLTGLCDEDGDPRQVGELALLHLHALALHHLYRCV